MTEKIIVCILGGPASGKSTVCELLSNHIEVEYIPIGEELRKIAKTFPSVKESLEAGIYTEENERLVNEIISRRFRIGTEEDRSIFLFDGYPRFNIQVNKLLTYAFLHGAKVMAFVLQLDSNEIEKRFLSRKTIESRLDDTYEVHHKRTRLFFDNIGKIFSVFLENGVLIKIIDAKKTSMDIYQEIVKEIEQYNSNHN